MRVFLTGGTGYLGQGIVRALRERGDTPVVLTRNVDKAHSLWPAGVEIAKGDPVYQGEWQKMLAGCDAVIHLAGEPADAKRWDARFKQVFRDSRVDSASHLVDAIAALEPSRRPRVLVSVSGIDGYPATESSAFDDDAIDESVALSESFFGRVVRDWEAEVHRAAELGVRVVCLRTGIVLGAGGALRKLTLPFRFFIGGRLGNGRQWLSWVHYRDVVTAFLFALDEDLSGPVNLVAPQSVRNAEFAKVLGKVMGRPALAPAPAFAVRLAAGELADYLLRGRRAVPKALEDAGFQFAFPELEPALRDALGR